MKECSYEEIKKNENRNRLSWMIFFRQIFVASAVWVIYFSLGLSFGAPTVLITQMRKETNSSDAVSSEMESWLSSVHGYSSLPFVLIIPIAAQLFGRKMPFLIVCLSTVLANILFYWSTTTVHVLISEIMHGPLLGSNITFLLPTCSEYASPHYREIFLTIKATCFFWGVWVANTFGIGTVHWRNIGIIGLVCCIYSLSAIFWPESPSWLALKERYEEAATSHHWLKGYDEMSEKELENLIRSQKVYHETRKTYKSKTFKERLMLILDTITTKSYYYPLILCVTTAALYHFSGKFVCIMYAMQLIHQITNSEETAYMGMLLLEGITILGMSFGCFLSKYMRRKILLLVNSSIAVAALYVLALYLYLIHLRVFDEKKIISLLLLVLFSITISCGPLIIAAPLFGELVSLKYKCSSLLILSFSCEILMATILKLAPSIFQTFELHGTFLFFAIFTTAFIIVLFKYLPETKGKSLQEIEDLFINPQTTNISENLFKRKSNRRETRELEKIISIE